MSFVNACPRCTLYILGLIHAKQFKSTLQKSRLALPAPGPRAAQRICEGPSIASRCGARFFFLSVFDIYYRPIYSPLLPCTILPFSLIYAMHLLECKPHIVCISSLTVDELLRKIIGKFQRYTYSTRFCERDIHSFFFIHLLLYFCTTGASLQNHPENSDTGPDALLPRDTFITASSLDMSVEKRTGETESESERERARRRAPDKWPDTSALSRCRLVPHIRLQDIIANGEALMNTEKLFSTASSRALIFDHYGSII